MSVSGFAARATVAAFLSGVLVVTLISPVAAAEHGSDPGGILPAPESTAAEAETPTIPEGSFTPEPVTQNLIRQKSAADPRPIDLENLDLDSLPVLERDEFTTAYDLPGSRQVAVLGDTPLNVEIGGEWVPVDETLAGAGGGWVNEEHPLAPEFSRRSGGEVVTVMSGEYELGWRLLGAAMCVAFCRSSATARREIFATGTCWTGWTWSTTCRPSS